MKRQIDKKYLNYINQLPCVVCGQSPCDPHHPISRGAWGSDYYSISLCRQHHTEAHTIGRDTFQSKYNFEIKDIILQNLIGYIKKQNKIIEELGGT
jgi:hypothetical protein